MGSICSKTVGIGTPTDNQILRFDSGGDKWGPENLPGGGGADVKAGTSTVTRGGTKAITFTTAFSSTPRVVVCFGGNNDYTSGEKGAGLSVYSISTTGFTVRYDEPNGSGPDPATFEWIATDAGDP